MENIWAPVSNNFVIKKDGYDAKAFVMMVDNHDIFSKRELCPEAC